MLLSLSRAGRRRGRKEKLLRLNLEARLALEGGQDKKLEAAAGRPNLGGGLNTDKFLRIFRLHRSNKADSKMFAREHTKVRSNPAVIQSIPSEAAKPIRHQKSSLPQSSGTCHMAGRLVFPRTCCTVNLQALRSPCSQQGGWLQGRRGQASRTLYRNSSRDSRTTRTSRISRSSRTSRSSKISVRSRTGSVSSSRCPERRVRDTSRERVRRAPPPVVSPLRPVYHYKTLYPGII